MRTFDIALKHLNNKTVNFKDFDIYNPDPHRKLSQGEERIVAALNGTIANFQADKENDKSNDYFRNMTFATAVLHLVFKAHGLTSFWDVAKEIIEANKAVLQTEFEGFSQGSVYPKVMTDAWSKYCKELKEKGVFVLDGESNLEYFMGAFHYVVEPEAC